MASTYTFDEVFSSYDIGAGITTIEVPYADGEPLQLTSLWDNTTLIIEGADMPEQGVMVGQKLRVDKVFYPGNNAPVTQVMGVEFEPLVFTGVLRDDWTSPGQTATFIELAKAYHAAGHQTRLVYGDVLVRTGLVSAFAYDIIRDGYARYKLTFDVDTAEDILSYKNIGRIKSTTYEVSLLSGNDQTSSAIDNSLDKLDDAASVF